MTTRTNRPLRDQGGYLRNRWRARTGALGGTRTPNLLIRRLCHASLLPGHMPRGLQGCRSLPCVICRSFAVLYGQNQATGTGYASGGGRRAAPVPAQTSIKSRSWSTPGSRTVSRRIWRWPHRRGVGQTTPSPNPAMAIIAVLRAAGERTVIIRGLFKECPKLRPCPRLPTVFSLASNDICPSAHLS